MQDGAIPHEVHASPRGKREPRELKFSCPKGVAPDSKEAGLNRATRRALKRKKGQAAQHVKRLKDELAKAPQKSVAEALPVRTRRKAG